MDQYDLEKKNARNTIFYVPKYDQDSEHRKWRFKILRKISLKILHTFIIWNKIKEISHNQAINLMEEIYSHNACFFIYSAYGYEKHSSKKWQFKIQFNHYLEFCFVKIILEFLCLVVTLTNVIGTIYYWSTFKY